MVSPGATHLNYRQDGSVLGRVLKLHEFRAQSTSTPRADLPSEALAVQRRRRNAFALDVIERLYAERVPGQDQVGRTAADKIAIAYIPSKLFCELAAETLEQRENDFRIRQRPKRVAAGLLPEFRRVVDLHSRSTPSRRAHTEAGRRLDIHDGQPCADEADVLLNKTSTESGPR